MHMTASEIRKRHNECLEGIEVNSNDDFDAALRVMVKTMKRLLLIELLDRHDKSRTKISSQCDTLISKKLVEDMIKGLE